MVGLGKQCSRHILHKAAYTNDQFRGVITGIRVTDLPATAPPSPSPFSIWTAVTTLRKQPLLYTS
ncbi:hypothetical protein J6590_036228 [Homalodisca vitripennis]|nr:hypothetical protein J6590_036228 [Homalodisca vitripennis]